MKKEFNGRTFCCGDIHGNYKGLIDAISNSDFNYLEDRLIILGDLVDGGPESYEVIDFLASLPNKILIKGNHDVWFTDYLKTGYHPVAWTQGGHTTAISYILRTESLEHEFETANVDEIMKYILEKIPQKHKDFMNSAVNYYLDKNNNLFVHGGFDRFEKIENQEDESIFYWDRKLWNQAMSAGHGRLSFIEDFKTIFIGHTTTLMWNHTQPMYKGGIYNLDTGAGSSGKVTIMNVETKQYYQSRSVKELYGEKQFKRTVK